MKPKLLLLLPVLLALTLASAGAGMHYVNLANPSPAPPNSTQALARVRFNSSFDAVFEQGVHRQ